MNPTKSPRAKKYYEDKRWFCHGWANGGKTISYNYEDTITEVPNPYAEIHAKKGLGLYSIVVSKRNITKHCKDIPLGEKLNNAQMLTVLKHAIGASKAKREETRFGTGPYDIGIKTTWGGGKTENKKTLLEITKKIKDRHPEKLKEILSKIRETEEDIII